MLRALSAEIAKLKRSMIPLWTAVVVVVFPLILGRGAANIRDAGGVVEWFPFVRSGLQLFASWYAIVIFGLVVAYLFGREYVDGTWSDMLVSPIRREWFLLAKALLAVVWTLALTAFAVAVQSGYAALFGATGFTWDALGEIARMAALSWLLILGPLPVVALLAVVGRSYMVPMVYSAIIGFAGLAVGEAGHTLRFPWAMQIGVTGMGLFPTPKPLPVPDATSWAIAAAFFAVSASAVVWYVRNADAAT